MPRKTDGEPHDWVTRAADDALRHAGEGAEIITVSSGASPSGRVHLGNLREFLTVHFVAEELRRLDEDDVYAATITSLAKKADS